MTNGNRRRRNGKPNYIESKTLNTIIAQQNIFGVLIRLSNVAKPPYFQHTPLLYFIYPLMRLYWPEESAKL